MANATPPQGMTGLRDYLTGMGYNVDWNQQQGVLVNNKPIDTSNFQLVNDRYYGNAADINAAVQGIPLQNAYQSQYAPQLQQMLGNLANAQPYQSPYTGQIQDALQGLGQKFEYDPNSDKALQQAQQQAMAQTSEAMGSRGMLYSDATKSLMTQEASKLVPQYEQLAFNRYQQGFQQQLQMVNFLNELDNKEYRTYQDQQNNMKDIADFMFKLDDRDYQIYKDTIDQRNYEKEMSYKQSQDAITNQRNAISDAWDRVDSLGYVDNETSAILGIPVGTLSREAQKEKDRQEYELKQWEREVQEARNRDAINFSQQKELIEYRDQLDQQQKAEDEAKHQAITDMTNWIYDTTSSEESLNRLKQNKSAVIKQLQEVGYSAEEALRYYQTLLADIEESTMNE